MAVKRLTRSRTEVKIAGVCGGLAEYFDTDVVLIRAIWLVLSIVPGAVIGGVIAYLAAWLLLPEPAVEVIPADRGRRLMLSNTDKKIAGVCGGLAEYFDVDVTAVRLAWLVVSILFGAIVLGVVAYLAAWIIIPRPQGIVLTATPATPAA